MKKMKTLRLAVLLMAALMMFSLISADVFAAVDPGLDLQEVTGSTAESAESEPLLIAENPEAAAESTEELLIADNPEEMLITENTESSEAAQSETPAEPEGPHGSGPWTTNNGSVIYMPFIGNTSERVFDYGGLLLHSDEESLRERIAGLEKKKNAVIVILTSRDIPLDLYDGTQTTMTYAEQFFMDLTGYSDTSSVDGFLFVMDMNNRVVYTIGAGRFKGEKYVDFEEEVYNDVLSDMRNGNYGAVCNTFLDDVYKLENIAYAAIPTPMSLIVSAILSLLVLVGLLAKHNKSQPVNNAKIAVKTRNYRNLGHSVIFLGKNTTSRRIERNTSSGGGGGGFSGGSHSGGGFSGGGGGFSGGGGKF